MGVRVVSKTTPVLALFLPRLIRKAGVLFRSTARTWYFGVLYKWNAPQKCQTF